MLARVLLHMVKPPVPFDAAIHWQTRLRRQGFRENVNDLLSLFHYIGDCDAGQRAEVVGLAA
jgi:hypothetical protein